MVRIKQISKCQIFYGPVDCIYILFILCFIFIFLRKAFHSNCTIKQRTVNHLMRNKNSVIYHPPVLRKGHGCRGKGSAEMYVSVFLHL